MKTLKTTALLLSLGVNLTSCIPATQSDVQPNEEIIETKEMATDSANGGKVKYLNNAGAFNQLIANNQNVVVDFYADWCGPCRNLGNALTTLAKERSDVLFLKVNIDSYKSLANQFGVRSIPYLVFFKDGNKVGTSTGFNGIGDVRNKLNKHF